jgi:DNA-binding IclR family transcriptional regulator
MLRTVNRGMTTEPTPRRSTTVQSVDRACAVLDRLSASTAPRSALELSEELGLHRTIVHRLLRTLTANGMAREERGGRYLLGPRALLMGLDYLERMAVRKVALPYLLELRTNVIRDRPWAVTLGVPVEHEVVLVERVWHEQAPLSSLVDLGVRLPIDRSAAGWSLLAYYEPMEAREVVGRARFRELKPQLEEVRRLDGLAFADSSLRPGISALATPIFLPTGRPTAAAIVAGSELSSELHADSEISQHLRRVAELITVTLRART